MTVHSLVLIACCQNKGYTQNIQIDYKETFTFLNLLKGEIFDCSFIIPMQTFKLRISGKCKINTTFEILKSFMLVDKVKLDEFINSPYH